jgi:hypothetical protein
MDDRERILARRARFMTSALFALGCAGTGPKPSQQPVVVPVATSEPTTASAPVPPRAEPTGEAPSLEVPADAKGIARNMYEALAERAPKLYAEMDALLRGAPAGCDLSGDACRKEWGRVAEKLADLAEDVAGLQPICPGTSEHGKRYSERVADHIAYGRRRLAALAKSLDERFAEHGSTQSWVELRTQVEGRARAQPCLDCATW